ncbi:Major facilitator superfamily mfs-1 [Colletotrichum higginsianum IMI 349063]|uniref:Major facilitator superfamily mfs-1 n=2 Tax=Colletotrichum higginsianum TaxID=80884 RepID=A0A1B7Y6I7_COLHI|nr:Major facilitator superfamily mfs-1 [Colletotrichum higginsianum IMI 349063]OBR07652.1 Major facilitator superfamily mfs-1 [Colletotrichum higginsianum IMI 349063]TIC92597.1 hypothetical protein CH35J_010588 [Colletotrichum higginsianum]
MAPNSSPPPTYHVVPRFDIAAKGGALELGIVVEDLMTLRPLNRESVIPIRAGLRYPAVTHNGFAESRSRLREGHGGIWARALVFQGAGVSADASAQQEGQSTVACDALVTSYFDPDADYVARTLASRGVDRYFSASGFEDDVFLVTGLKVAKKLRYNAAAGSTRAVDAEVSAVVQPNAGAAVGVGAGGAAADEHSVEFEADDVVVGFRVSRYAYVPASRNPFVRKKKKLVGTDYLENARMHGEGNREEVGVEAPRATYERVPIEEEEEAAQKEAKTSGGLNELWVIPAELRGSSVPGVV